MDGGILSCDANNGFSFHIFFNHREISAERAPLLDGSVKMNGKNI
jgi:hypothetical protein